MLESFDVMKRNAFESLPIRLVLQLSIAISFSTIILIPAQAAVLTNDDVIQLHLAGLGDEVIIAAISQASPNFDVSVAALIKLKNSGVSSAVIARMLGGNKSVSTEGTANRSKSADNVCSLAQNGLINISTKGLERRIGFKKAEKVSQSSGAGRALAGILTFGIVTPYRLTHYAVLSGSRAETRLTQKRVEFGNLAIERGLDPGDAIKLVSLSSDWVTSNANGRILPIGEGSVSYWGSVQGTITHTPVRERVLDLEFERQSDDCVVNGRPVTLWRATNTNALGPGEYAILLDPDRYHDFAIEDAPSSGLNATTTKEAKGGDAAQATGQSERREVSTSPVEAQTQRASESNLNPVREPSSAAPKGVIGVDSFTVERLPEVRACHSQPVAIQTFKGPGFDTYSVKCASGELLVARCEFGNCRIVR